MRRARCLLVGRKQITLRACGETESTSDKHDEGGLKPRCRQLPKRAVPGFHMKQSGEPSSSRE